MSGDTSGRTGSHAFKRDDYIWRGKVDAELEQTKVRQTETKASLKKLYENAEKAHSKRAAETQKLNTIADDLALLEASDKTHAEQLTKQAAEFKNLAETVSKGEATMVELAKTVTELTTEITKIVTKVVMVGTIVMVLVGAGLSLAVNLLSK